MGKEIVGEAFIFIEKPEERDLTLFGKQGHEPSQEELEEVTGIFEKLHANEPDVLLDIRQIEMDRARNRLVVGLGVRGTHEVLHAKANSWVGHLGDGDAQRHELAWAIGH